MCALVTPSLSRYSPSKTISPSSSIIRVLNNLPRCAPRALHSNPSRHHAVVFPVQAHRSAWTRLKRGAVCVTNSHKRLDECTVALQNPRDAEPVAYVLGVAAGNNVTAEVDTLVRRLQQQQQQQLIMVLLDPAAVASATVSVDSEHDRLQQLQQHLGEMVAAYGGQLQVLPQQQQQAAGHIVSSSPAAGAAEQCQASIVGITEERSSSNAETTNSSSNSGSMGSRLLSGLGQAGRVAAGAATAAASVVLDVIEGAAAATAAAIVAYEQRGVDVTADLPDTSLRPSAANDWRQYPEQLQLSWQAALTFCAVLIQLEKAGYDVVITSGDEDDDDDDAGDDGHGEDDGDESPQDRVLRTMIERGDLDDLPQGSLVRVIADKEGEILGFEVIKPEDLSDDGPSLEELLLEGVTPEEIARSWPNYRSVLKGSENDADRSRQSQQDSEAAAAAAGSEGSDNDDFTAIGMRVDDDGKVVLLGVDKDGNIRAKEQTAEPDVSSSSSSSGIVANQKGTSDSTSSRKSLAAEISLDALLQAGQLPLAPSSSSMSRDDSSSSTADTSPGAAADDGDGAADDHPDDSSSRQVASSSTGSSPVNSSRGNDDSKVGSEDDGLSAAESAESAADDTPEVLSSSDAIHLLKKEFRRRVSSAPQGRTEDDGSNAADAADVAGSSISGAASEDGSSKPGQQQGSGGVRGERGNEDDDTSDRLAVRSDNPELLAAMLQLERSWSSSASTGDSSSTAGDNQQSPASSSSSSSSSAAAAAAAGVEQLPELLPRPVRPPQPDENTSSNLSDEGKEDGNVRDSSTGGKKQTGLTPQEAAEVQAIIEDTQDAVAAAARGQAAAAARLGTKRIQQQQQLQQQDSGNGSSKRGSKQHDVSGVVHGAESGSDSDEHVAELFEQFERKLEAEGYKLSLDDKVALFAELYGQDSDDNDADSNEQEAGSEDSSALAASGNDSGGKDGSKSAGSGKAPAASGKLIRSPRAKDSSSSSSKPATPSGPGWEQLSRMVGPEALSKLPELLKSGNVRLSGLNHLEVSMLLNGLSRLQKGERLDSEEIAVLLRVINEAEVTPEGEERDLDEALKRRNKALRRQQQQSRAGVNRSASGRANLLGYGVNIKDRAYAQDTRSVRVPKSASRSRGEQVKQLLRQLRQRQQYRELQRLQRQALQYARLQLQANMDVEVDQDVVDNSRQASAAEGSVSGVQQPAGSGGGGAPDSVAARSRSKQRSSGIWKDALRGMQTMFNKAAAPQQQQQQPQQEQPSSASSVDSSRQQQQQQRLVAPDSAVGLQQQQQQQRQAMEVRSAALVQRLQSEVAVVDGSDRGGDELGLSSSGERRRIVIAVVPLEQLESVQQAWEQAAGV